MKKSIKWKIICLVCLTAVSLTGCGDRKDIENSSYVLAMGFEKINDKYLVRYSYGDFDSEGSNSGTRVPSRSITFLADSFADANRNVILQTLTSEKDRLQKNLSMAEQIYSQSMGQLQVLRGKVQEAKPVFAVVEPATVPLVPASPKKMLIITAFAFLAFVLESAWILFGKDIYHDFKNELKKKD